MQFGPLEMSQPPVTNLPARRMVCTLTFLSLSCLLSGFAFGVGGSLTVTIAEEETGEPTIARFEMHRVDAPNKTLPIRRTVPAGIGVILDRELLLEMPEANYQFRLTRGPEYRMISGTFALEKSSLDSHRVELPRMANMLEEGWISGDCATPASDASLPLRMASEDLHVVASIGHLPAKPIAGRNDEDPILHTPTWIRSDLVISDGLAFYGIAAPDVHETSDESKDELAAAEASANSSATRRSLNAQLPSLSNPPVAVDQTPGDLLPIERILEMDQIPGAQIAVENPFAWPLPVWLASERVDGIFVMSDWLRLDRQVKTVPQSRPPIGPSMGDGRTLGRWAERIYWHLLEAGFRMPPLAGTGDQCGKTPVGYNRLYVAVDDQSQEDDHPLHVERAKSEQAWWNAAWEGKSIVTNGPMLRPKLAGRIPGHLFTARVGEKLTLQPELNLSVRDPVEYLEVIHNGEVHYSARLDEFAKAGGIIPAIEATESGWVIIRVATLHEEHFRAALSAPWYIEFDSQPRINERSVAFFQEWQAAYESRLKQLSSQEIQRHAPFVIASREFWNRRFEQATVRK